MCYLAFNKCYLSAKYPIPQINILIIQLYPSGMAKIARQHPATDQALCFHNLYTKWITKERYCKARYIYWFQHFAHQFQVQEYCAL